MVINGQVHEDLVDRSVSVGIPVEWLGFAVKLYKIAANLHAILRGPQVQTHVMIRQVWLERGEVVIIYWVG